MPVYIDVGDGTLILPPPKTPDLPPAPPPPPPVYVPPPPPPDPVPQPRPIVPPGQAYIDVGDGTVIPAPPATAYVPPPAPEPTPPDVIGLASDQNDDGSYQDVDDDLQGDLPDFDAVIQEFAAIVPLRGDVFVQYVKTASEARGLDPLAVAAEYYNEGIGGGIGDHGSSYGPWQLHDGGRLPRQYWGHVNDAQVNTWAWSKAGINYALDGMAKTSARGKSGNAAVYDLTHEYEHPANLDYQTTLRQRTYGQLANMGGGAWSFLAGQAKGPKVVASAPKPPPTTTTAVNSVGAAGAWRELCAKLNGDVAGAGRYASNVGDRLAGRVS